MNLVGKHIAICTPTRDGSVSTGYCLSLMQTIREGSAYNATVSVSITSGCSNLPRNRNLLTAEALYRGADYILFIDSDIQWKPDDIFRLAGHDRDIVGGLQQKRASDFDETGRIFFYAEGDDFAVEENGLAPARCLPTAFMMVKSEVFREMRRRDIESGSSPYIIEGSAKQYWPHLHNYFWYRLRSADIGDEASSGIAPVTDDGEDFGFCRHASGMGFRLYADTNVELAHFEGSTCFSGSPKKWLQGRRALRKLGGGRCELIVDRSGERHAPYS